MTPRMYVPVYHNSGDMRVIQWVQKNLLTHELNGAKVKWSDLAQKTEPAGKVNLRMGIKVKRPSFWTRVRRAWGV